MVPITCLLMLLEPVVELGLLGRLVQLGRVRLGLLDPQDLLVLVPQVRLALQARPEVLVLTDRQDLQVQLVEAPPITAAKRRYYPREIP